jgi:hypothetical protein
MMYTWAVTVLHDEQTGLFGARWVTAQVGAEGQPVVSAAVNPTFREASDARGHAAMWIARYEDAVASPALAVVDDGDGPWTPTDVELVEALAAHRGRFAGGDVTLGGG